MPRTPYAAKWDVLAEHCKCRVRKTEVAMDDSSGSGHLTLYYLLDRMADCPLHGDKLHHDLPESI